MQAPDLQQKIDTLTACGPLKAWSVIVTILGDLCQARSDRIGGRDLNGLAGRMGLTPPAVRVALHRLKRDGWTESERHGRDAAYRLSAMGWKETQAVRDRIYGTAPAPDGPVYLLTAPPHLTLAEITAALPADTVMATPRTALLAGPLPGLPEEVWASRIEANAPPDWLRDVIAPPELRSEYAQLADAAYGLVDATPPADIADAAALRLLTLHHWRRLRLRHGNLPDILLGDTWEGAVAARVVMEVLEQFPRPDLDGLSA